MFAIFRIILIRGGFWFLGGIVAVTVAMRMSSCPRPAHRGAHRLVDYKEDDNTSDDKEARPEVVQTVTVAVFAMGVSMPCHEGHKHKVVMSATLVAAEAAAVTHHGRGRGRGRDRDRGYRGRDHRGRDRPFHEERCVERHRPAARRQQMPCPFSGLM
eukprot:COSAG02_NODE_1017_length_15184_cov_3.911966_15_plen_156_part_01